MIDNPMGSLFARVDPVLFNVIGIDEKAFNFVDSLR